MDMACFNDWRPNNTRLIQNNDYIHSVLQDDDDDDRRQMRLSIELAHLNTFAPNSLPYCVCINRFAIVLCTTRNICTHIQTYTHQTQHAHFLHTHDRWWVKKKNMNQIASENCITCVSFTIVDVATWNWLWIELKKGERQRERERERETHTKN